MRYGAAAALTGLAWLAWANVAVAQGPLRLQVEPRVGFLVTFAEGHPDRPLGAVDIGIGLVRPNGGTPGMTLTAGVGVGFAEFFADAQSESFRIMAGVETPFALSHPRRGGSPAWIGPRPVELVPHVQAGALTSNGGDERDGFAFRAALGLRVPLGSGRMHFTFEPFGLVRLPAADFSPAEGVPPTVFTAPGSRWALELGIIKLGWRF